MITGSQSSNDIDFPDDSLTITSSAATKRQSSGRTCTLMSEMDEADDHLNQSNGICTGSNRSIAYDVSLSSNVLSTTPLSTALPARMRARLKPIDSDDRADTAAMIHKLIKKQQRAAIRREAVLQEKKRQAQLPIAQLHALAALTKQSLEEKQEKVHLRREEKLRDKMIKACRAEKSPWFLPDSVSVKGDVVHINDKQRQAESRRQALEDIKLKKARDSGRSHWYTANEREVIITRQQLFEKQARADTRRKQYLQERLQNMKRCEEETKRLVERIEPLVLHAHHEGNQ